MSSPAAEKLSARLRTAQVDARIPAVSAQVGRGGEVLWADQVHATAEHAFRMGSITKTFTAVSVLQCRDAGLLDLDDPLAAHLPVDLPAGVTIRRCLAHLGGVQREPAGDVWAGGPAPDDAGLLAGLADREAQLVPARRFHYSNLAYALLGRVVAERRGAPWYDVVHEHLLAPLQLTRTTVGPSDPAATGGFTEPWTDVVRPEPEFPTHGVAPAAQLWSTAGDLARWGAFLIAPDEALLAATTAREMAEVQVMADTTRWSLAFGLGVMLYRRGDRVLVGHGGAMPGFLSTVVGDPESGTVAAVLTAAGREVDVTGLAAGLLEDALEADPPKPEPWVPGGEPPAEVRALLGHWWTEGSELVLSWHDRLEARLVGTPAWLPPAVFEPAGDGRWLTVSGREAGEILRTHGDGELRWATYALTRAPKSFGELFADA